MQEELKKSFQQGKPPSLIFSLMIMTNILINLDHGILPACTQQMKIVFDMDEFQLGLLGSVVYLGISLMGIFAGRLYQHLNSKLITLIALGLLQVSLLLFVLSDHKITAYLSRFATGVCQVFLLVYYPIWIDKFGKHKKTFWLTLLQICVPIGIFIGYGMTAVILSTGNSFRLSFYIQIGLVVFFILTFFFLSKQKLDSRRRLSQDMIDPLVNQPNAQQNNIEVINEAQNKNKYKLSVMLSKLFKSKMYLVGTFTMAVILFVSTGIQFWLTSYFIDVLQFQKNQVFIAYAIVSSTGPTTGCAFGGFMVNRIGGYQHPHTIFYVFFFSVIGLGSAIIIPFVQNFWIAVILLWLVLYFGGAMMPGLTGLMMCSVSPYLRAFGNSTGEIIKNVFGYLPSPFVYGLFNSLLGDRAGIKFLMFWGLWAPFLLAFGSIHRYRQIKHHRLSHEVKVGQKVVEEVVYSDQENDEKYKKDVQKQKESDQAIAPQQNRQRSQQSPSINNT